MAFYFILHPGEYANATGNVKHLFPLQDVKFKIGAQPHFDVSICNPLQFLSATFVSLTFTTQKNGVKGEKIGHTANSQRQSCPVKAVLHGVAHLISPHAPLTTPLHIYYTEDGSRRSFNSAMIMSLLRSVALTIPGHAGIKPSNIAARSLCSIGAMALLLSGVDPDTIRIVSRWRSDAMFHYLHGHALPLIRDNSHTMFQGGHYNLFPHTANPHP